MELALASAARRVALEEDETTRSEPMLRASAAGAQGGPQPGARPPAGRQRLQPKLLRVLEDQTIQRLGSDRSFKVDMRLLSATSRENGAGGKQVLAPLRRDLFFRLAATILRLSERRADLPDSSNAS